MTPGETMSKTILLADDSLTIQKVVELTFMEGDYEVASVSNGDDAMSRLDEVVADLVIADIHMPGASGYEICKAVKERSPETPVLLLVGTFEPFEATEMEECGADGHLKKPFDSQELVRLVEELLSGPDSGEHEFELHTVEDDETAGEVIEAGGDTETEGFGAVVTEFPTGDPDSVDSFEVEISGADESFEAEPAEEAFAEGGEPKTEVQVVEMEDQPTQALSDDDVDRIARRVIELMGNETVREIAWDVIPDLAEIVIKDRLRELESQVD
jgi:CheY-like chemotaxis protein